MQPKRNKWILIGVLIFAVLVGAGAIGTVYYYNSLDDVTPSDSEASLLDDYTCDNIFILNPALESTEPSDILDRLNHLDSDVALSPAETYTIGATFTIEYVLEDGDPDRDPPAIDFVFTINGESTFTVDDVEPSLASSSANPPPANQVYTYTYLPLFEFTPTDFADLDGDSTLTIEVEGIFPEDADVEPLIELDHSACIEQDSTFPIARSDADTCIGEGETFRPSNDTACCTGLEDIAAIPEPNDDGECRTTIDQNRICVISDSDGLCTTGENICNSPNDCSTSTVTCSGLGETYNLQDNGFCCEGLEAVGAVPGPNDDGECLSTIMDNFICIESDSDGVCGTGENACNSSDCTTADCSEAGDPPGDAGCCTGLVVIEGICTEPTAACIEEDQTIGDGEVCCSGLIEENGVCIAYVEPDAETSSFGVTKTGTTCVERVSPYNVAEFTITVANSDDTYEDVLQILDKLPLGFTYVAGSTSINGIEDATDQYLTIETVGSAQELTWAITDGWSVAPNGSMVVTFSALAGANALTGDVQNEVVITPRNNPTNEDTLRTEFVFSVAQNCETPVTGLFDSTISKIIAGFTIIALATLFYWSKFSNRLSVQIVSNPMTKEASSAYDGISIRFQKLVNPRESFERKFLKDSEKKSKAKKK